MSKSRRRRMAAGSGSISTSPICAPANSWPPHPSFPSRRARFSSLPTSISSCKGARPAFTASLPISSAGLSGATEEIGFLHFALTEKMFISSRRHQLNAIEATRKALRLGAKVQTPAALLELIAGQMIESLDHFADGLADQLDQAEERILADELNVDRKVVGSVRRTTVRLHRQLVTLRSLIQRFEHEIEESENPALNLRTKKLLQRLDWLDTEIVELRDRSRLLQEEIMLKGSEQTNRSLHVLAIVTTVFLPATLVTGVFGMNVAGLPLTEDKSGFVWAMRAHRQRLGLRLLAVEALRHCRTLRSVRSLRCCGEVGARRGLARSALSRNSTRKIAGFTTVRLRRSTPAKIASAASVRRERRRKPRIRLWQILAAPGIVLPIGGLDRAEHDQASR